MKRSYLKRSNKPIRKKRKEPRFIDLAWTAFSRWIRKRDSNEFGQGNCITCGIEVHVPSLKAHAGHFIHGKYKKTYFNEKNVHLQCRSCNFFKDGARDVYALKLIERYGDGIIQELHKENKQKSWTKTELEEIIKKYEYTS